MGKAYTLHLNGKPLASSDSKAKLQARMRREQKAAVRSRTELPSLHYTRDLSAAVDFGNSGRSLKHWEIIVNAPAS